MRWWDWLLLKWMVTGTEMTALTMSRTGKKHEAPPAAKCRTARLRLRHPVHFNGTRRSPAKAGDAV